MRLYRVDTMVRVKYFKTEAGAINYTKRFNTSYREVIDPQEIIWAKKQLKMEVGTMNKLYTIDEIRRMAGTKDIYKTKAGYIYIIKNCKGEEKHDQD